MEFSGAPLIGTQPVMPSQDAQTDDFDDPFLGNVDFAADTMFAALD